MWKRSSVEEAIVEGQFLCQILTWCNKFCSCHLFIPVLLFNVAISLCDSVSPMLYSVRLFTLPKSGKGPNVTWKTDVHTNKLLYTSLLIFLCAFHRFRWIVGYFSEVETSHGWQAIRPPVRGKQKPDELKAHSILLKNAGASYPV